MQIVLKEDTIDTPLPEIITYYSANNSIIIYLFYYIWYYQSSYNVALITEVAPVAIVLNFVLQRKLLIPLRE